MPRVTNGVGVSRALQCVTDRTLLALGDMRCASLGFITSVALAGCGGGEVDVPGSAPALHPSAPSPSFVSGAPPEAGWVRVSFRVDPQIPAGNEQYVCLVLDAPPLAGRFLRSVRWTPPGGAVAIHHATLYGFRGDHASGPVSCAMQPEGTALVHVYTPGAVPLALPPGVALELPPDTAGLAVEAHALRLADGAADTSFVELLLTDGRPDHVAGWVDDRAPVPTIDPHTDVASTGRCRFGATVHVVSTWPHMHRAGKSFYGSVVRHDGRRESFVELDHWDFSHQGMYPRDVTLEAGDAIETLCVWANPTDSPIFPGSLSTDEMCNQGLYVWPVEDARCVP